MMSLRLLATTTPRMLSRCQPHPIIARPKRGLSTSTSNAANNQKRMTPEEVEEALKQANETMKDYYSYPPEKVISAKRAKFNDRHMDNQFYLQLGLVFLSRSFDIQGYLLLKRNNSFSKQQCQPSEAVNFFPFSNRKCSIITCVLS